MASSAASAVADSGGTAAVPPRATGSNSNEAFACILDRSGAPVSAELLASMSSRLGHYGETTSAACCGPVGAAVRHATGAHRLVAEDAGPVLALSGRLEYHDEPGVIELPDLASAHRFGGSACLARICSPFALVYADPGATSLSLSRDQLGQQKVYYYLDHRWLVAASEPSAILAHPAVRTEPCERAAARFLGFDFSHWEGSFFRGIRELPPAQSLRVGPDATASAAYWRLAPPRISHDRHPALLQHRFRELVSRSIAREWEGASTGEVGLSLSGGLDAPLLAALSPAKPRCYSWIFASGKNTAEEAHIEVIGEYLDLPLVRVPGDSAFPLCDGYVERFVHPESPYYNPFAMLKYRLYRRAAGEGCRIMMVGDAGDTLYGAAEYWLRDLLATGQLGAFLRAARAAVARAVAGDSASRIALRRLLPARGLRRYLPGAHRPWMTRGGRALLPAARYSPVLPPGRSGHRADSAAGSRAIELESEERRLFAQCGVGRSNPLWSWPLLQELLHAPAYQLQRGTTTKLLAREAMVGRLPDRVLTSARVGELGWLFLQGIHKNRSFVRHILVERPRSDWSRFVSRDWLLAHSRGDGPICFGHTILWRVICYELWLRRLDGD